MPNAPFIQVILPLKLTWEPFYRLPEALAVENPDTKGTESLAGAGKDGRIGKEAAEKGTGVRVGDRVQVDFGGKECAGVGSDIQVGERVRVDFGGKEYVGVVSAMAAEARQADGTPIKKVKEIEGVAEGLEPVTPEEIRLWRMVADYYLCTVGEVYKAAYPALKVAGEAVEARKKAAAEARLQRRRKALELKIGTLQARLVKKDDALKKAKKSETAARYASEKDKIAQELAEAIREYGGSAALQAPRGGTALAGTAGQSEGGPVTAGQSGGWPGTAGQTGGGPEAETQIRLNEAQTQAYSDIKEIFRNGKPALLHGVTGSGKTEIYLKLAQEALAQSRNVLYLVPEIALSKQLEDRLAGIFPQELLVFHSGETMAGRREVATAIRNAGEPTDSVLTDEGALQISADKAPAGGTATGGDDEGALQVSADKAPAGGTATGGGAGGGGYLVLGTRSALFLPHRRLGLVVVDEEHDTSYKQDSPAPRYNGRETAIMLAGIHGADIVLGSATPSLESLYNCSVGRYGRVRLTKRYFDAADSEVEIVDTIAERRKRGMVGHFSRKLIAHIQESLDRGEQVVVLRERRAFAPLVQCEECGHIPQCKHCNVRLSLHKRADGSEKLVCHYCGRVENFTGICPKCGGKLVPLGAGTQQIEEEARALFPQARIARLDSDSAQNRTYETDVIRRFTAGGLDLLIGTQIVTKGFDFSGLRLVAVLQADSITGLQDFRADERGLQLLEQFRGRCGRRGEKGLFVIQTSQPDHPVYREISGILPSEELQSRLLAERKAFGYPPYSRVIGVVFKDYNPGRIEAMSRAFGVELRGRLPGAAGIEGPYAPAVDKISGRHIRHLRVLLRKDRSLSAHKQTLADAVEDFERERKYSGHIALDVDPA